MRWDPKCAGRMSSCAASSARAWTSCLPIPGGASMELHQALTRTKKIRTILPRFEQGGGFMAHGYARATGKVGVCMATSGPGATNLVTCIADAYMDSIPLVAITGQVFQTVHRQGRVSGDGLFRDDAADHQAQLPGAQGRGPAAHVQGSLPHRQPPAGPARW